MLILLIQALSGSGSGSGRILRLLSGTIRFQPDFKNCYPVHPYFSYCPPQYEGRSKSFEPNLCTEEINWWAYIYSKETPTSSKGNWRELDMMWFADIIK